MGVRFLKNNLDVFQEMINVLHFVHDVKEFKDNNPDEFFIHKAVKNRQLMKKDKQVLGDGIRSLLDYDIELKEKKRTDEKNAQKQYSSNIFNQTIFII